ncbi:NAD+ synthase [bacterium]|nr:NAD+ synthase [bacterium]
MKIALAQEDPTVGDLAGNVARFESTLERARGLGCDLVVGTELAVCGYPPRDLLERKGFVRDAWAALLRLAKATSRGPALIVGVPEENRNDEGRPLWNSAAVLEKGEVKATVRKRLLPTYDVFDEDRYFEPAPAQAPVAIAGVPFGITVCEDMWCADPTFRGRRLYRNIDPVADAAKRGAKVLVNISASPFHRAKVTLRHELVRAHALAHGLPFLFANQVGGNDELVFDGSSFAFDSRGRLSARSRSFEEDLLVLEVDPAAGTVVGPSREEKPSEIEEVYRALVLGTRDYARKCGFQRALLGLSGGIDSALTAAIAADALGPANVLGVSMPSRFSSQGSKDDAHALARNLGIRYTTIPIEPMFEAFLASLAEPFVGRRPDVTEENVQARIRGTILMALSNKFADLLLTTGNKSEMATGYCTLYGDMAGGLAVISDVPKMLVYELSRFVNRAGERIPLASIEKPPSAELRPDQKDEDSLPPYRVLDQILDLYIEEMLEPEAIVARGFAPDVVSEVVRMVERNEYKRKQAPPGLKVTSKAFGVGRRYPIAKRLTKL